MDDYYLYNCKITCFSLDRDIKDHVDPTTYLEAIKSQESSLWLDAMKDELDSIEQNKVWELCELPKNRKSIGCNWILK